jgi:3-methyl-2-oxobutanoate hydroxymethyltransferase
MNILDFKKKKQEHTKICMITCYDYPSACIVAASHVDCVLVGDSVAMTVHGHPNTITATLEMMVLHTKAVARGITSQFIVSDLPFLFHKKSLALTVDAVMQLMQAGASAIKIEGADTDTCHTINHLVQAGVPILGHIGLTPQSIHQLGGFKVQGKNPEQADLLIQQAHNLAASGCCAIVLECVPHLLAKTITESISIPTIGIGAGAATDGQVLVWHDLLGLDSRLNPKFAKKYCQGKELFLEAVNQYAHQVHQVHFPEDIHSF